MNAGQRSTLQGTMDARAANYGAQVQAYNTKILEGNTSPAELPRSASTRSRTT